MDRRSIFRKLRVSVPVIGLLALAAMLAPLSALAQSNWPYTFDPSWPLNNGNGDANYHRGEVAGVGIDQQGHVILAHGTKHPILVFDRQGNFIKYWGDGLINEPHCVRIDSHGHVWIADINWHMVSVFTWDGQLLRSYGLKKHAGVDQANRFNQPTDVAFGPQGDIYISDGYGNSRIVHLDSSGNFIGQWGTHGTGPGEFRLPHSVVCDAQGNVYVADRSNHRIQEFDGSGNFLRMWTPQDIPWGLAFTPNQRLLVVSGDSDSVTTYDTSGNQLGYWKGGIGEKKPGRPEGKGSARPRTPGMIGEPHMVAVDTNGDVYIAELAGHRAERFDP